MTKSPVESFANKYVQLLHVAFIHYCKLSLFHIAYAHFSVVTLPSSSSPSPSSHYPPSYTMFLWLMATACKHPWNIQWGKTTEKKFSKKIWMGTKACVQIRFEVVRHAQTYDSRARTADNFVIVNNTQMSDSSTTSAGTSTVLVPVSRDYFNISVLRKNGKNSKRRPR